MTEAELLDAVDRWEAARDEVVAAANAYGAYIAEGEFIRFYVTTEDNVVVETACVESDWDSHNVGEDTFTFPLSFFLLGEDARKADVARRKAEAAAAETARRAAQNKAAARANAIGRRALYMALKAEFGD